jgi:methylated-DNA-[protein]-cysteine S-methyltransferase
VTAFSWASISTPVGLVCVGCSPAGVAMVRYAAPPDAAPADSGPPDAARTDGGAASRDLAAAARRQLAEYFSGRRRTFDLPVDWSATSGTQRDVLQILTDSVGYGDTTSYGVLARQAGLTDTGGTIAARLVGRIMGSNPIPLIVPCHRVLASDGLGGYSGGAGIEVKRWLLILEGALPPTLDWQPAEPPP